MKPENKPAFYFPLANGRYEVSAGFNRLDRDFGNGPVDQQIFQFDNTFQHYRDNKLACRHERLAKYYQLHDISPELAHETVHFLIAQLCEEHPDYFHLAEQNNHIELTCSLTGEILIFSTDYDLQGIVNGPSEVTYESSLDAIASQLQEDLAVVQLNETGEFLCALHLCSPNHWAAEDKIGKSFLETHRPVPHMEKINQQATNLFSAVLEQGPYVRFAWGLATDTRLNHHPLPPTGIPSTEWCGRQFNPDRPELWLRVERQTLTGLRTSNAVLFTIRTYFYDVNRLPSKEKNLARIATALESMSNESLNYKGLQHSKAAILSWLYSTCQN